MQTSSNLATWSAASTNIPPEGTLDLTDTNATTTSRRFYRLLTPVQ